MNDVNIDISGVKIGCVQDVEAATGVTVILCEQGAIGAADVRGGGPATRETDLLRPENSVESVNAIVLSGGSAFGLDAATGVMRYLEERGCGFPTGVVNVPIVCGASLFDLGVGSATVRPDADMGYAAAAAAGPLSLAPEGNVGAGTGATVGKLCGPQRMMKCGQGVYGVQEGGVTVVAVSAVNAVGSVVDADGKPIAGVLSPDGSHMQMPEESIAEFASFVQMMREGAAMPDASDAPDASDIANPVANTTISCVITNAKLTKAQAAKACTMCHDGYARAINPVHSSMDGDTIFLLATGEVEVPLDIVGMLGAQAVAGAIRRAATQADDAYGIPSAGRFA